jgi:hypothetical protein
VGGRDQGRELEVRGVKALSKAVRA